MSEGPYRVSNGFHGWSIQVEGSVPLIDVPDLNVATAVTAELNRLHARAVAAEKKLYTLRNAARDMLGGWRYIRHAHGDLYGVGWDRAQSSVEAALDEIDSTLLPVDGNG